MRTTIDIPDETYRGLKMKAVREGTTFREVALRGMNRELHDPSPKRKVRKLKLPLIPSRRPGSINPTEEQLIDAFFGPID